MTPIEHFNTFCELFGEIRILRTQGKIKTKEAKKILYEMVLHYNEFDEKMERYVDKWKFELVELGFYIQLHCPKNPDEPVYNTDVTDIETEYKSEEFDENYLIFRKDFAHKDKKEVIVANYCPYSTPWSLLGDGYQNEIIKRTKENMANSMLGLVDPKKAKKNSLKKVRKTPMKWSLSDYERDW